MKGIISKKIPHLKYKDVKFVNVPLYNELTADNIINTLQLKSNE